jgi:predicted DCC family thiol-disulfide oxidoreductase YuxK
MTGWARQGTSVEEGRHLVLYDGVCGLCSRLLQFLLEHDRRRVFSFAPLQGGRGRATVARWGGNPDELTTFHVIANFQTADARMLTKGAAAVFVAGELGWPWKAMRLAGILPVWLLNCAYDAVARSRYRVFGRYDQCLLPRPEFRSRFIE